MTNLEWFQRRHDLLRQKRLLSMREGQEMQKLGKFLEHANRIYHLMREVKDGCFKTE